MIRALWRRWLASLRSRPWQTALLLGVVTISAIGITAGLDQQRGAAERWDDVFAEVNGAHLVIYGASELPLDDIAGDPAVTETAGPFRTIDATLLFGSTESDLDIRGIGTAMPTVTKPLLTDGRWLTEQDRTGIVLDTAFALDRGISVGDAVTLETAGGKNNFQVVGLAVDTVDCLYLNATPVAVGLSHRSWRTSAAMTTARSR